MAGTSNIGEKRLEELKKECIASSKRVSKHEMPGTMGSSCRGSHRQAASGLASSSCWCTHRHAASGSASNRYRECIGKVQQQVVSLG
ncbi:hypothetical protein QJQ45_019956 [Haematococcus lacustris]|nr:hypothetical protein QJQ45_019956 [Haematococcus lacustris]